MALVPNALVELPISFPDKVIVSPAILVEELPSSRIEPEVEVTEIVPEPVLIFPNKISLAELTVKVLALMPFKTVLLA